jgi:hypothetical protein
MSGRYPCLREDAGILPPIERLYCTMRGKYKYRFINIAHGCAAPKNTQIIRKLCLAESYGLCCS